MMFFKALLHLGKLFRRQNLLHGKNAFRMLSEKLPFQIVNLSHKSIDLSSIHRRLPDLSMQSLHFGLDLLSQSTAAFFLSFFVPLQFFLLLRGQIEFPERPLFVSLPFMPISRCFFSSFFLYLRLSINSRS